MPSFADGHPVITVKSEKSAEFHRKKVIAKFTDAASRDSE